MGHKMRILCAVLAAVMLLGSLAGCSAPRLTIGGVSGKAADIGDTELSAGEYLAYLNDKPILLVCDNSVFVKKLPGLEQLLADAPCGVPYPGAREHYQLDIEDAAMLQKLIPLLEQLTPLPVKKSKSK